MIVAVGERAPAWYGKAYARPDRGEFVCYPIPLNYLVGWLRSLWWLLRFGPSDPYHEAYMRGLVAGSKKLSDEYKRGRVDMYLEICDFRKERGEKVTQESGR